MEMAIFFCVYKTRVWHNIAQFILLKWRYMCIHWWKGHERTYFFGKNPLGHIGRICWGLTYTDNLQVWHNMHNSLIFHLGKYIPQIPQSTNLVDL